MRPSSRERLGSCPRARWVRMLQRERRSLRHEAISTCNRCVRWAPAGWRPEEAWLEFLCSGSLICSCSVRFCSSSSWFWADSYRNKETGIERSASIKRYKEFRNQLIFSLTGRQLEIKSCTQPLITKPKNYKATVTLFSVDNNTTTDRRGLE